MITITAFEQSPDDGRGLARDTRIHWALEEVGQPYEVRLVSFRAMKEPAHLALHPFGQISTYEEGDLTLFETGAIVFHTMRLPGRARSHGCSRMAVGSMKRREFGEAGAAGRRAGPTWSRPPGFASPA